MVVVAFGPSPEFPVLRASSGPGALDPARLGKGRPGRPLDLFQGLRDALALIPKDT